MPKVPTGKKYLKVYSEKNLEDAVQAVRDGMPKKRAAVKFNVPRATLQFRLSDKFIKNRPGPSTVLTQEEENVLVDWIITSSRKGFPRRREDLVKSVKEFLDKNPRPNQFIQNTPGEGWYKLFMKRHPEITERTSEAVTSASSKVSEKQIRNWFKQIELYLKEHNLFHIFNEPSRILNGDETNFMLCPKNTKVLAPKGDRNVYEVDHAEAKSCVTVMFTFSAAGKVTPPMIIFPLKKMRQEIQRSVPSEWGIGLSDNGWMQSATFFQYVKNVLHPALVKDNVQFPVILFVDGHKSHTTLELSQLCQNLGIILIALYPNATRILQPADVSAFRPVKTLWRKAVLEWRINNMSKTMTKTDVGPILKVLIPKIKESTLINGFCTTGLCPFNPDAIDYRKCLVQSKAGPQEGPTTPKSSLNVLSQEEFNKIIGSDLERRMRNQVVGPSKEAKTLYEIFKYFLAKREEEFIVTNEGEVSNFTKKTTQPEITEESEQSQMTDGQKESEMIEVDYGPEITDEIEKEEMADRKIIIQEKESETENERKVPEMIERKKELKMLEQRKEPDIAEEILASETTQERTLEITKIIETENEKEANTIEIDDLVKNIENYDMHCEQQKFNEVESRNHEEEESEYMNHHQLMQEFDVPEPAQNFEILAELNIEPDLTTSSQPPFDYAQSIPSTSRQDIFFINEKWVPLDTIPIAVAKGSPVRQTLNEFLVFPKTPIKKNRSNQEHRSFVLTSKEWENEELKKQNKKLEVIQLKEERKKQRLEKAKEKQLDKERKQAESLKKKLIKKESQKQNVAKQNQKVMHRCNDIPKKVTIKKENIKEKPKIIENILIRPANYIIKENTFTPKEKTAENENQDTNTTDDLQPRSNQISKPSKFSKPLTEEELVKILQED